MPTHIIPSRTGLVPITPTSKHRPISWETRSRGGGEQLVFRFPNGFGASVVYGLGTYGHELAVVEFDGPGVDDFDLTFDTPITDNVLGWLSAEGIETALDSIAALPSSSRELTA